MDQIKFKYDLSENVKAFISNSNLKEISIGCSDSQVIRIENNNGVFFLKIASLGLITSEYKKLTWLEGKLNVPHIVLYDAKDNVEYLVTSSCSGEMVCSDYYLSNPEIGIKVIAESFKQIEQVDIADCPFNVDINYKLNLVEKNVENNLIKNEDLKLQTLEKYKDIKNVLKYLKENKFEDDKCFSHGDTSLPNIFAENNHFSSFIDVGECGIADKWFDLAICERSIRRNYGDDYIDNFYQELNIIPDRNKINYYLLMMELYL